MVYTTHLIRIEILNSLIIDGTISQIVFDFKEALICAIPNIKKVMQDIKHPISPNVGIEFSTS